MHEPCKISGSSSKQIHIKFDSDEDAEEENDIKDITNAHEISKNTSKAAVETERATRIECSLIKIGHEKSFGFEIKGNSQHAGGHFLDSIDIGSPAHRAGIERLDKMLQLNGVDVAGMTTVQLIGVMEREVRKFGRKINLVIERAYGRGDRVTEPKAGLFKTDKKNVAESEEESSSESDTDAGSQTSSGISQIKKRLKLFEAMDKEATKVLSEKIEKEFNQKAKRVESEAQVKVVEHVIEANNEQEEELFSRSTDQIRQDQIDTMAFISPQRPFKRAHVPSRAILNIRARDQQRLISGQGRYVFWQEVIYELLRQYNCEHIGDLGLVQADHLYAIGDLLRLQKRIDTFLISYECRSACVTLVDIERAICNDYNYYMSHQTNSNGARNGSDNNINNNNIQKVTRFDELFLGPLLKNQIVREIFKLPDEIRTVEQMKPLKLASLFKHMEAFLKENNLWAERKVKQEDFERYLVTKLKVKSIAYLGVKINSIAQLIGSIKNVQYSYGDIFRDIKLKLGEELNQILTQEKKYLLKYLSEKLTQLKSNSDHMDMKALIQTSSRLQYASMESWSLVEDFLGLFDKFFSETENDFVRPFLKQVQETDYLRDSFQLAICLGRYDIDACLEQIEENKNNGEDFSFDEQYRRNQLYNGLLKRVFFLIIDAKSRQGSNKEVKRLLNSFLKEKNLRIVSSSYKQIDESNEKEEDYRQMGFDYSTLNNENSEEKSKRRSSKRKRKSRKPIDSSDESTEDISESEADVDEKQTSTKAISTEVLTSRLVEFIRSRFEPHSQCNFEHLIKIEKELWLQDIDHKNSDNLTFVEFIQQNRFLFRQLGISLNLINDETDGSQSAKNNVCLSTRERAHLFEHVRQLMSSFKNSFTDSRKCMEFVMKAVCTYYNVSDFKDLKIGEFETIVLQLNKEQTQSTNTVIYIDSLQDHSDLTRIEPVQNRLTSNEELIKQLVDCPLLENLHTHLNWPKNKDLKETLVDLNAQEINFHGTTSKPFHIDVLETQAGTLLKLAGQTSIELLKKAIEDVDGVNASGHLISLIALKYSVSTPTSLIANEIESSLAVCLDKCNGNKAAFYQFLITWILRIPLKLANQIIFKFIIGPVAKLENDNMIKAHLFKFLVDKEQVFFAELRRLIQVGEACSITEWSVENHTQLVKKKLEYEMPSKSVVLESVIKLQEDELKKQEIDINAKPLVSKSNEVLTCGDDSNEYEHVVSIRKRYGIGIELDEQSRSVADSLKGVIGRSLESLSNELYNKDMHFVLELIQNADDNSYGSVEPTLVFLVETESISLFNNEIGFDSGNVSAICDVKASTKGKHQRGYIGRKGIGFKSVFTMTDRPEIHSNRFHIQFDSGSGHIGYILPNWISSRQQLRSVDDLRSFVKDRLTMRRPDLGAECKLGSLATCIRLPLKSESERQRHKSSMLTNNLNDIKPYLLLFLNRLRNIVILQKSTGSERVYHRTDISKNLIKIETIETRDGQDKQSLEGNDSSSQKWLVTRESLQVPVNLRPVDTVQIESTDLCLAFAVDDTYNNSLQKQRQPKMDVFAYLPLRSFGFSFIIQADFVVPASRQDVTQDSDWNQWIIKQIPNLFVSAFHTFRTHPDFKDEISALIAYMRFVPLEQEVVGCFQSVPRQINELLRNEEFLPVIASSEENDDGDIVWKKPFECVLIQGLDDFVREVLTSNLLKKHLGRYYLHPRLVENGPVDLKVLANLGVRVLDINDLIEILKSVFSMSKNNNNNSSTNALDFTEVSTTAKWLVVLQHCLSSNYSIQQEEAFINQIKQLPFIPIVKNGSQQLVSLSFCPVFFSFQVTSHYNKLFGVKSTSMRESLIQDQLESDLNLLDADSLLCLDELKNSQIISILKLLGVRSIQPKEIIENHIYSVLGDKNELAKRSEIMVIDYLLYMHECWQIDAHWFTYFLAEKLKHLIPIKTNRGLVTLDKETSVGSIYLTPQYGNKYDLAKQLPSYPNWNFVDKCYLDRYSKLSNSKKEKKTGSTSQRTDQNMLSWRRFLILLGMRDVFTPVRNTRYETIDTECSAELVDYECPVIGFYMQQIEAKDLENDVKADIKRELSALYRILEDNWDTNGPKSLKQFKYAVKTCVVFDKSSGQYLARNKGPEKIDVNDKCESKFFSSLRSGRWILAESTKFTETTQLKLVRLEQPKNVYVKEQIFLRYFGQLVTYAIETPSAKSSFAKDLGLKLEFNITDFIQELHAWLNSTTCFQLSITQMRNIYNLLVNYLGSYETKADLREQIVELLQQAVIFVPNSDVQDYEKPMSGRFYPHDQVYWYDPTGLFNKYKGKLRLLKQPPILLEHIYNDQSSKSEKLKQIFLKDMGIAQTPSLLDYIDLLENVCLLASTNKAGLCDSDNNEALGDIFCLYEVLVDKCVEETAKDTCEEQLVGNTAENKQKRVLGFDFEGIRVGTVAKERLVDLIKFKWIIPCFNNKWLSLANEPTAENNQVSNNHPVLVDDIDLAEKFTDQLDMLISPFQAVSTDERNMFQEACSLRQLSAKQIFFLLHLLDLKLFSQTVLLDLENITECLQEAPSVQNLCRRLVPFIQYYMYYRPEFKSVYTDLSQNAMHIKLAQLKFYSVQTLQNVYRSRNDASVCVSVSNKTCLDLTNPHSGWKYLCRADIVANDKDVLKGFVKLFASSEQVSESDEKQLVTFCLLINQLIGTNNSRLREEDIRELEKDYRIKFWLPSSQPAWCIQEAVVTGVMDCHLVVEELSLKQGAPDSLPVAKRQKKSQSNLMVYEQLSRNQINLPGSGNDSNGQLLGRDKMVQLPGNLMGLASSMDATFNIENLKERQEISFGNLPAIERVNQSWTKATISNLKNSISNVDFNSPQSEYIIQIGRWGEIWVNEMLKKKYQGERSRGKLTIEWVNETSESGLPYDIRVLENKKTVVAYIEVKTTTRIDQESFPISYNELMFAQANADKYYIYRLYNACRSDPSDAELKIIRDIPSMLNTHGLNLFIVI